MKLLLKNIEENLDDLEFDNDFLDKALKVQALEELRS